MMNDIEIEDQGNAPPYSIKAEQSVIGGLLLDSSAWDDVIEEVSDVDFYKFENSEIFKSIKSLCESSMPVDIVTVSEDLTSKGVLSKIGGIEYLAELVQSTPSVQNIKYYSKIIREKAVLRSLIEVSGSIAHASYNTEGRPSSEILDEAERLVFEIAEKRATKNGPKLIKPMLADAIEEIDRLFSTDTKITGMPTGFDDLDAKTSGFKPGDLVIIAGRPAMGKTTFSVNCCENAVMQTNKPVLVFSMEMPNAQLVTRMLSSLGRIDQGRMRTGQLEDEDWPRLNSAISLLADKPFYIDDSPALSPNELRARARRVARENNGEMGVILVDYLQLMQVPGAESRVAEISEISRSLKALAKEMECPVLALSQLNRSLEQRPNKRPVMSDLRESGAIEQDADIIMFIYRDEVYNPESPEKGMAEIIIGKQRNGPIGTVKLAFLGKYTKFENLAMEYSTFD